MLTNTGTVSFILYGIFIAIAIIGLFIAIYFINKQNVPPDKLEKIIDLSKYTIISVCVATVTLIISDLFKEREQDVKELEYFDKYAQDVKKVDGIQERYELSRYLSIVAPSGYLKTSWQQYYDTLKVEYHEYIRLKKEQRNLDTLTNPTEKQLIRKQELNDSIEQKESPLVSGNSTLPPRVYIHISEESQRDFAKTLQATLLNESFLVPGIENIGKKGNRYIPTKTEVRYYREEELPGATRLISIIKSQNLGTQLNEVPQKIPGTGRGTRPGHFEIWFSKPS